ncbi:MAG: VWA domain-containing protein [Planctomycetales bacterium]|nr:VWA domain-containing protein [Planctomycetales bacterium]
MATGKKLGGVIHTYQKYDPRRFPSPTQPPPDLVSSAFDHLLMYGSTRRLTDEELARAIRLDPSQIAGLGPSLEALIAMLLERKRKILERYETDSVRRKAADAYRHRGAAVDPPRKFRKVYWQVLADEQIYDFERLWYQVGDDASPFARGLVDVMERLGEKYEVEELAAKYTFTGRESMAVPQALAIKEELEKIDELLKQLEEASKNAQIGVIDMDLLSEFAEPGDMEQLGQLRQMIEDYMREMAERQGIERDGAGFRLTPKAYRLFQSKLLEKIFANLQASRTGRHQGPIVGEGSVQLQQTKPYEFGDSIANMDIPQSMINAMLRTGGTQSPLQLRSDDIVVHRTRNSPKCATVVVMDMSGSMRYDGQYINVKRMGLALQGLIQSEYPGDFLRFIEMATFAKVRPAGEVAELMPKPVTIFDPWVRLKVDMSRDDVSEYQIHPHFTNIQHALRLSRQMLATQDTPNRQVIVITDGLPTAHFEGSWLYMLYPPDPLTEAATMREGMMCQREGITINLFLVPSWSQSEEDIRFAYRLAETTNGRVFFTAGADLDRYVVWDYVNRKREIIT